LASALSAFVALAVPGERGRVGIPAGDGVVEPGDQLFPGPGMVAVEALLTESRGDGEALRSMDGPHDTFVSDSRSWADEMAEAGFLVTMVSDRNGAHVEVC